MFRVKDVGEAMRLAKELCARHPELLTPSAAGDGDAAASPKDVAVRILLAEMQRTGGRMDHLSPSSSSPSCGRSPFIEEKGHHRHNEAAASGPLLFTPQPAMRQPSTQPIDQEDETTEGGQEETGAKTKKAADSSKGCPYCDEPTSRYCKETGRRHEGSTDRALRLWRRMYRQLAIASQFVNTARLQRPNTCVEDFSVELDLS